VLTVAISCCFDTRGELQAGPDCFAGGLGMFLIILLCRRQAVFVADLTQKQHPAVVLPKKNGGQGSAFGALIGREMGLLWLHGAAGQCTGSASTGWEPSAGEDADVC
jgi:hypothetical protein